MGKIKDKPCHMCAHREICDRKNIYINIIKAINSIKITASNIDNEPIITELCDLVWLNLIPPVCVNFQDKYISGIDHKGEKNISNILDFCKKNNIHFHKERCFETLTNKLIFEENIFFGRTFVYETTEEVYEIENAFGLDIIMSEEEQKKIIMLIKCNFEIDTTKKEQGCDVPEFLTKKLVLPNEVENDSVIINKIAAEFPYSISEVKEIYYKYNKSISTTILKLTERIKNGH